jgi:hypothetical protein
MTEKEIAESISKVLNTILPKKFDFIERIKDVKVIESSFYDYLKFKIVLKKDWVEKNFTKDSMEYINDDFEIDGYSLLGDFTVGLYSNGKIKHEDVLYFAINVIKMLGTLRTSDIRIDAVYIIE